MNKPLSGKTAIVTGSSSGIGYATASALAQAGAAVVIHARRKDRLDGLASEIAAQGGKVLAVAGDASIQTDIDLLVDRALSWEEGGCKVDIVVVNAGRGLAGGILGSDESQWQELYQVNVLGAAHLMRRAGQYHGPAKRRRHCGHWLGGGTKYLALQRILRFKQVRRRRHCRGSSPRGLPSRSTRFLRDARHRAQ